MTLEAFLAPYRPPPPPLPRAADISVLDNYERVCPRCNSYVGYSLKWSWLKTADGEIQTTECPHCNAMLRLK